MEYPSILAQSAQMVAALLIALLIWPVVQVIRERYLRYWAWGWVCLAVAVVALFVSFRAPAFAYPLRAAYCLGGYGFGFLLWAGSRRYATGRRLRTADLVWLVPAAVFAAVGPATFPTFSNLFGWHAAIQAVFFAATLAETRRFRTGGSAGAGVWLFRGALLGLTALFAHYAVLLIWHQFRLPRDYEYPHLAYSSLYDLVLETVLALGMVTIATERMRAELVSANQRLATVVTELEGASRTDPLTGLLNRRVLTELLADPHKVEPGCVAAIDINDLKPLNDRYGHAAGDVALQLLARALRNLFRVTDPLFRLGGDEFLVLMPGGSLDELTRRMEALDRALLGQRFPDRPEPIDVRVAWGVAGYADAAGLAAAVKAADEAMYAQKAQRKGGGGR
jgi:diguanylate cyclase (GGDEF)-like protein